MTPKSLLAPNNKKTRSFLLETDVILLGLSIFLILFGCLEVQATLRHYDNAFYPGVFIDGVEVAGKTKQNIEEALQQKQQHTETSKITIAADKIQLSSSSAELGEQFNYADAVEQAYSVGRNEPFISKIWRVISPKVTKREFQTHYTFDQYKVAQLVAELKKKADETSENPNRAVSPKRTCHK